MFKRSMKLLVALSVAMGSANAPAPQPVRFAAVGDFNWTANTVSVLDGIAARPIAYTNALGDFSYSTAPETQWCADVTSRLGTRPVELISGNHESNGQNGQIENFAACLPNRLPELGGTTYGREYYLDTPSGHSSVRQIYISPGLTFPDGTWNYTRGSAHYNWVATAIEEARAKKIPWVVVNMHKPCLSVGVYSCDPGPDLVNLLVSKRVDLVLSGHEHHYARTKQLTCVTPGSYTAACVADADNNYTKGRGTVFATIGTGGAPLRTVETSDSEAPYFAAFSGSNQDPAYGFLDVTADATTLDAHFTPVGGAGFTDHFTISK